MINIIKNNTLGVGYDCFRDRKDKLKRGFFWLKKNKNEFARIGPGDRDHHQSAVFLLCA